MSVSRFAIGDAKAWHQAGDRRVFLSDVVDASNSATLSVGFARYDKGATNAWTVTHEEALIVTKGVFTVRSAEGTQTASAGEVIFLTRGTKVVYQGDEDDTRIVYVTYPHWFDAQRNSEHAALLDEFHPVEGGEHTPETGD